MTFETQKVGLLTKDHSADDVLNFGGPRNCSPLFRPFLFGVICAILEPIQNQQLRAVPSNERLEPDRFLSNTSGKRSSRYLMLGLELRLDIVAKVYRDHLLLSVSLWRIKLHETLDDDQSLPE